MSEAYMADIAQEEERNVTQSVPIYARRLAAAALAVTAVCATSGDSNPEAFYTSYPIAHEDYAFYPDSMAQLAENSSMSASGIRLLPPVPKVLVNDISSVESQFPPLTSSEYVDVLYDEEASSESAVVYRHEGLEQLSFTRPTLETSKKILDASSIEEVEDAARPFFRTLGLRLYMTDVSAYAHTETLTSLTDAELDGARNMVLTMANEISSTPREVIRFANVQDVLLGTGWSDSGRAAWARWSDAHPGIMAFNVEYNWKQQRDFWHHEFAHHLAVALNRQTNNGFDINYLQTKPDSFEYKAADNDTDCDPNKLMEEYGQAYVDREIVSAYAACSLQEDSAETYPTLWHGEMSPSPDDPSIGTPVGYGRVLWVKYIDSSVPGFEKYVVGLSTEAKYAYQMVPKDIEAYNTMIKYDHYPR